MAKFAGWIDRSIRRFFPALTPSRTRRTATVFDSAKAQPILTISRFPLVHLLRSAFIGPMNPVLRTALAIALLPAALGEVCRAGDEVGANEKRVLELSPFTHGRHEFQFGVGGFYSFGNYSETRPKLIDVDATVRLGLMLTTAEGDGALRGNWELLLEAFGGAIAEGPGDVLAGASLLLRYNFVQPDARWVPYFQFGGGGAYSDAHEVPRQRLLGSEFMFNLQGGIGLRYLCSSHCAIFVEADYRHLSNAGLADRNCGANSVGGYLGLSWFF